jgi:thiol-disulfide isomerase/thioredoxin
MRKLVLVLILIAALLITAGCTDTKKDPNLQENQEKKGVADLNEPKETITPENKGVVELTTLEQINISLQEGPVLVKIGSERCGPCKAMKPILKELAEEYAGKATIMSMDIDKSPELAIYFGTNYIPDSSMIVNIENGEYVYMQEDGKTTADRIQSRILGLREKEAFETLLDYSLQQK